MAFSLRALLFRRVSRLHFLVRTLASAGALLAYLAGCASAPTEYVAPAPLAAERAALNSMVFTAAWDVVDRHYFDPKFKGVNWPAMRAKYAPAAAAAADDEALYRVLREMTRELRDPHTYPISPRTVHEAKSRHSAWVGLNPRRVEGQWAVTDLAPNTPATAAGVKPGWIVVSRDGEPLPEEMASGFFAGPTGIPTNYAFIAEQGQPRTLAIAPQLIRQEFRLISEELAGGIRYLRFDYFNRETIGWLESQIKAHRRAPGMILDLRHNPGGRPVPLRRAVRSFFPEGRNLGHAIERNGKIEAMDTLSFLTPLYEGPVVILTSETTASSAEIFSRALQYYQRARIVGQPTSGAVLGGSRRPLPGGGYLNVTQLDFRDHAGQRLEGVGVTPDTVVPLTLADLRAGHDAARNAAMAWLASGAARPIAGP